MPRFEHSGRRQVLRQIALYVTAIAIIACADPRPATFLVGCGFVAVAWSLRIWSFGHLEKNELLVTTGPYAHSRNPAYFGSFLALIGVAIAAGNAETLQGRFVWGFCLVLFCVFFGIYLPRKFEREYGRLKKLFGQQAERHAANVPDFWPQLKPWRSGDPRRFSWNLVAANHELPWGPVLAGLLAAIWFVDRWSVVHGFFG
jgi:protein-S-isoprenylcysteine O-methyltransferase Ste14